ncbi:MAG: hypothetical protein MI976_19445 [Pseudomonadales bacterium]|nr:hypothetical protein [Pseudomonadales bacterium]
MKLVKLSVLASAMAVAGAANAGPVEDLVAGATVIINMSGASASDKTIRGTFGNLCTTTPIVFTDRCTEGDVAACGDTVDVTGNAPALPGKSYAAYYCEMDNTTVPGLTGTERVLVRKRSAGGSFFGTVPVAQNTVANVNQMVLNDTNCAVTADANIYKCDKDVVELTQSEAGVSDEEPTLFKGLNVPAGNDDLGNPYVAFTSADLAQLDRVASVAALTFGVPVTNALYVALQEAQGLNSDLDGDTIKEAQNETGTPEQILAEMPSLSREQVSALITGSVGSWADVTYGGTALTSFGAAPSDDRVSICRRVNGSGTQAQMNAVFLNAPCYANASSPASDNTSCTTEKGKNNTDLPFFVCPGFQDDSEVTRYDYLAPSYGAPIVHENSGSGDVTACLDDLQDDNRWAIGVQSLEKDSSKWSFIKINKMAPTLENVARGNYIDWAASSIQYNFLAPKIAEKTAILDAMIDEVGTAAVLEGLNDDTNHPFAPEAGTGLLGFAHNNAGVALRPFNITEPMMQHDRGGDTCRVQKATNDATDGVEFGN